jgi:anaphase-promoting complex subunit 3
MPSPAPLIARGRQLHFGSESETPMRKGVTITVPLPVPHQTPLGYSESSGAAGEMPAPTKRAMRTTRTNSVPSFVGTSPRRSTRLKPETTDPPAAPSTAAATAAAATAAAKKPVKKPPVPTASGAPPAAPKAKKSVGLTSTGKQPAAGPGAGAPSGKVALRRSAEDAMFVPTSSDSLFNMEPSSSTSSQDASLPIPTVVVEGDSTASADAALAGTVEALTLLRRIGDAFRKLCRYDCFEAIETFKQLPSEQYNTGWVLVHVGRAYFEMIEYAKAQNVFEQVRLIDPQRLLGMETFSTTLWHLRRETDLSFLAQELTDIDKNAPETLCAIGNCFSLQKEHEMALKYFQRAVTVDPEYVYAYTLSGHEHIAVDQWDAALDCFRRALRLDPRHYNAWFGLGIIYLRQEKYEYAEYHFRKAIAINGRSSVLFCYVGMVLSSLRRYKDALDALNQACKLDPKNVLAKFKRASVYVHLTLYKDALMQLESIMETSPREVAVLYMVGRIYKKLKDLDKAQFYLTQALDMDRDSKTTNFIKSTIDSLHIPDNPDDNNFELL